MGKEKPPIIEQFAEELITLLMQGGMTREQAVGHILSKGLLRKEKTVQASVTDIAEHTKCSAEEILQDLMRLHVQENSRISDIGDPKSIIAKLAQEKKPNFDAEA